MGSMWIEDFKGRCSEDERLEIHLKGNHFPPIHSDFIPPAKKAIKLAQEAIDTEDDTNWGEIIELPNGKELPVSEIIEGLHLDGFLEYPEEEY